MLYAAGKNEVVVRDIAEIGHDNFFLYIDIFDNTLENRYVPVICQHISQWSSNISFSKSCHCHLIQQRLEKVVVFPVDKGNLNICFIAQYPGSIKSCKASSNNHNLLFHI